VAKAVPLFSRRTGLTTSDGLAFWDNCNYAYLLSCFVNIGLEHIEAAITTLHIVFLISTFYQT